MPKRKISLIWESFVELPDGKAKCKHCGDILTCGVTTSPLWNHIKAKHRDDAPSGSSTAASTALSSSEGPPKAKQIKLDNLRFLKKSKYDKNDEKQKTLANSVAKFVADCMMPFSIVEEIGFKNMLETFDDRYRHIGRREIKTKLVDLYKEKRSAVEKELQKIDINAVTSDCWTGCNNTAFLSLTSHGINDNWELKCHALEVKECAGHHTAELLGNEMMNDWKLPQAGTVLVTDNGANIVAAARDHTDMKRLGCFAHTLQLAIGDALKLEEISELLSIARTIVTFFHSSQSCNDDLKRECEGKYIFIFWNLYFIYVSLY
jgi:hypothetical protein